MSKAAVYPCPYIPGGVDCGVRGGGDCKKCGWHPDVIKRRKARIRTHPNFAILELCDECLESIAAQYCTVQFDDKRKELTCDECMKRRRGGTYTVRFDISAKEDGDLP